MTNSTFKDLSVSDQGYTFPTLAELRRRAWQAFGLALTVECALVFLLAAILIAHQRHQSIPVVPISIESIEEQPVIPEEPIKETKPLPVIAPKLSTPEKPVQPQAKNVQPAPSQATAPTVADAPPVVSTSSEFSAPPAAAAPPPVVAPTNVEPSAGYVAKVNAAVKAAHTIPPALIALNFRGRRARVEFSLRDGIASQAHILISSGNGMADRSAVQAILKAIFPEPPASMKGKDVLFQIWVGFAYEGGE